MPRLADDGRRLTTADGRIQKDIPIHPRYPRYQWFIFLSFKRHRAGEGVPGMADAIRRHDTARPRRRQPVEISKNRACQVRGFPLYSAHAK
jgi:hypothetical protein